MKRIIVYADFDFLTSPEEIGTLGYEHVRGKDHFVFENKYFATCFFLHILIENTFSRQFCHVPDGIAFINVFVKP